MKKGFTLAEALIALSLLGVVAALTVPNILYTGNDKKFIAQARKVATTMQDAIDLKYSLYGMPQTDVEPLTWLTTDDDSQKSTLKTKSVYDHTVLTSDGIIYIDILGESDGGTAKQCFSNSGCTVCADINGSGGPTTGYSATKLSKTHEKLTELVSNKDIVCFRVLNGQIQTGENNDDDDYQEAFDRFVEYINEE